jgi:hypothetical protein
MWYWSRSICLLLLAVAGGCYSKQTDGSATDDENAVRGKFTELQAAVKQQDADKIWALLDSKSRVDAEKKAKAVQAAHAKARDQDKAALEEVLGLSGKAIADLTPVAYLKTKRFQQKYHEFPDSKIEKVVIQGDNAAVHFLEPDGDKEKLIFVRQEGQWKAWLALPKVGPPAKAVVPAPTDEEKVVRKAFVELQLVVKNRDADKLWQLLAAKCRTEAEQTVKKTQAAHQQGSSKEKADLEEALGIPGNEVATLTAVGFLKTKRFQGKYRELPDSNIEKVVVQGDTATVHYIEPDDDHEQLIFVREAGAWKAQVMIPQVK